MSCTWNRRWLQAADRLVCLVLITVASGRLLLEQTRVPRLRPLDEARTSPPPVYVVDINRAAWPELTLLPGIGPTLAKRIVAERRRGGLYRRPDDLLRVSGIGPRKLTALRPHVRIVRPPLSPPVATLPIPSRVPDRVLRPNESGLRH